MKLSDKMNGGPLKALQIFKEQEEDIRAGIIKPKKQCSE